MLCEACQNIFQGDRELKVDDTEVNRFASFTLLSPEEFEAEEAKEAEERSRYAHHDIRSLEKSAQAACHLCFILWSKLTTAEADKMRAYATLSDENPSLDIRSQFDISSLENEDRGYQLSFWYPIADPDSFEEVDQHVMITIRLIPFGGRRSPTQGMPC